MAVKIGYSLKHHWAGMSPAEIGASWKQPREAEDVNRSIEKNLAEVEAAIVEGVVRRAADGDLAAVEWLEARGFIPKVAFGVEAD